MFTHLKTHHQHHRERRELLQQAEQAEHTRQEERDRRLEDFERASREQRRLKRGEQDRLLREQGRQHREQDVRCQKQDSQQKERDRLHKEQDRLRREQEDEQFRRQHYGKVMAINNAKRLAMIYYLPTGSIRCVPCGIETKVGDWLPWPTPAEKDARDGQRLGNFRERLQRDSTVVQACPTQVCNSRHPFSRVFLYGRAQS